MDSWKSSLRGLVLNAHFFHGVSAELGFIHSQSNPGLARKLGDRSIESECSIPLTHQLGPLGGRNESLWQNLATLPAKHLQRGLYKRVYATPTAISSASHNNSVFFGFSSSKVLHHSRHQLSTRSFEPILQSSKMKFAGVMLALAVAATAAPSGKEAHNSPQEPFWPVKHDVTVEEVKTVCGEENQVLCCNEVSYVDESHDKVIGPLAGALGNLLGGKNGAKGLGLFDQCSHLNLNGMLLCLRRVSVAPQTNNITALGGVSELIHSQCKTNIACCNGNKASAVSRSILYDMHPVWC